MKPDENGNYNTEQMMKMFEMFQQMQPVDGTQNEPQDGKSNYSKKSKTAGNSLKNTSIDTSNGHHKEKRGKVLPSIGVGQ